MNVRHITHRRNVDEAGLLIDAEQVCHGTVQGGVIAALAGPVDPLTHLNRDFHEHELGECVVAEELVVGSAVLLDGEGHFLRASQRPGAKKSLGRVDLGARRSDWLAAAHRK
ncbi:hypothetical protein GA0111570_11179 [Raineyella antarctica]|uniref:Uncharacterized protein n=1 Tax=Raineyella antarctica TaxID=1577474 RepID=A0A1G6HM33_9ACTN|nr:hypothetical protein [Raineyella antarctica]SDB95254.1 hypothetical protein GA0111570_11179 [Raineyella antarctica]